MKAELDEYRTFLLNTLAGKSSTSTNSINYILNTDDHKEPDGTIYSWEYWYFHALPLGYVINVLSQIQCDIERAEGEVLNYFFEQINASVEEN